MKKVLVLGAGCPKCRKLFAAAREAAHEAGIDAEVCKVEDINEIVRFGVIMTPALVVDGEVKVVGRVPRPDELRDMIS
jgi:small redox-active disulfide protein 2